MSESTVRIALANVSYPDTPAMSVAIVCDAIAQAGAAGALVVCFPECFVPGYRAPDRAVPPADAAFLESAWNAIGAAAANAGVAVVLGTERVVPERADGLPIATVAVFDANGALMGFQDKVQLDPSEDVVYGHGDERRVFTVGPLTFGVVICHEGWRYPETVRWAARRGAQIVFHPHFAWADAGSYRPTSFADPANTFHEKAILCRAAENSCWFASVNCASDGVPITSAIARPDGTLHAWQPYGQAGLLIADCDLSLATGLLAQRCRTGL